MDATDAFLTLINRSHNLALSLLKQDPGER
jgi:hypothetical protein